MDHSLQTISYIADIGSLVVLMARRKLPRRAEAAEEKRLYKMICHVFHSADVSGSETLGRAGWCWGPGPHPAVVTGCLVSLRRGLLMQSERGGGSLGTPPM